MNTPVYNLRPRNQSMIPNVIFALLIINGLVFALQQFEGRTLLVNFALWPIGREISYFMPWQLVTYSFLHDPDGLTHIFFNMFGLWMLGRELEPMMGARRFLTYYFTCVVGAGLVQLVVANVTGSPWPTIGASGGVFGILLAYALAFPNREIMVMFLPIPIKAKYFVLGYGVLEFYFGISGNAPGIANFAHLGGMLFGFMLLKYWQHAHRR